VPRTSGLARPTTARRSPGRAAAVVVALSTALALGGCAATSSSTEPSGSPAITWSGESIQDGVPLPSGVVVEQPPTSITGARYPRDWTATYRLETTTTEQVLAEFDKLLPGTGWKVQRSSDHLLAVRTQSAQTDMLRAEVACPSGQASGTQGPGCTLSLTYTSRNVKPSS
jgi:hypothetical protein